MFFGHQRSDYYEFFPNFKSAINSCSPQIDIYNDASYMSNRDCMSKLRPREVETPIYPNGAHSFGASSPRVRFLDIYGSPLFLNNK